MTRLLTLAVLVAILATILAGCNTSDDNTPPEKKITVEVKLDDRPIPLVQDARVVVLPTGERILVLTGRDGMAACCLLPPKPEAKVER